MKFRDFRVCALSLLCLIFGEALTMAVPVVSVPPTARTVVNQGFGFSLNVTATGPAPLSYQWYHDNRPIAGATGASYTEANAAYGDRGAYTVKITDGTNEVTRATGFVLVQIPGAAVVGWGADWNGQSTVPAGLTGVVCIAAGNSHTVALKADGTVRAWGANWNGETTVPIEALDVVAIAAGGNHTVALKADGTVVAWGSNWSGQTNVPVGLAGVVAIAAGYGHSVALKADGTVVAWGSNADGQTNIPAGLTEVVAIAAGTSHTVALKGDGTVVNWGSNWAGQTTVPTGLIGVAGIAAGDYHTIALLNNEELVAWGYNAYGQINIPFGLSGVSAVDAGAFHSVALKTDGTVVAWGSNWNGETAVPAGLSGVAAITAGYSHTLALFTAIAPAITLAPQATTVAIGQPVTLSVTASGSLLSYQCYRNGVANPGETGASLSRDAASIYEAGAYKVTVSGPLGSVTSAEVALTVTLPSSLASATEAYALLKGYAFDQAKTLLDAYIAAHPAAPDLPLAPLLRSAARLGIAAATDTPEFLKTKLGATRADPADWAVLGTGPVNFPSLYSVQPGTWTQSGNSWSMSTSDMTMGMQPDQSIVFNNLSASDTSITLKFDQPNGSPALWFHGNVEFTDQNQVGLQLYDILDAQGRTTITLPAKTGAAVVIWYTSSPLRVSVVGSLPTGVQVLSGSAAFSYPVLKAGSNLTEIFDFLKVQDAAVFTPLLADLAAIPADAVIRLAASQIGSIADIVLTQTDREMIQAGVKFTQALRLLGETYDRGADLSNGDIFLTASWDEFLTSHPQFLTALAASSPTVRSQAKALMQQAVAHYRSVETDLWSRPAPAGGGSYLVSIDLASPSLATDKSNVSTYLTQVLATLDGATNVDNLVALRGMTGVPLGTQANLSSLFAAQAYDIRGHLPVTEADIRSGGIALLDGLLISSFAQTIDFTGLADCSFTHAAIPLAASADSGLDVSFSIISGPATVADSDLMLTGTGTVQVRASQAGNTVYAAAPEVNVSFVVAKVPLSISADAKTKWAGAAMPGLSVAYSGFVTGDTSAVLSGAPNLTTSATAGSLPGTYAITVGPGTLAASNYTFVFNSNTLTVTPWSMADWRGQQFDADQLANAAISGANADPDGDGLPNQLEYAFGESPTQATVDAAPSLSIQSGKLALAYTRRNDVTDLTYTVEVSSDLKTWVSGDAYTQQIAVTPLDGLRDRVTVSDRTALSAGVRRFMRVRVLQAEVNGGGGAGIPPASLPDNRLDLIIAPSQ